MFCWAGEACLGKAWEGKAATGGRGVTSFFLKRAQVSSCALDPRYRGSWIMADLHCSFIRDAPD